MLRNKKILAILKKSYTATNHIPGSTYRWNESLEQVEASRNPIVLLWACIVILVGVAKTRAVANYNKEGEIIQMSLAIVEVTGVFLGGWIMWLNFNRPDILAKFLNSLLQVEKHVHSPDERVRAKEESHQIVLTICTAFYSVGAVMPLCLGLGSALAPCTAVNLFAPSYPNCKCRENDRKPLQKVLEFLVVAGLNGLVWKAVAISAIVASIHIAIGFLSQKTILNRIKLETRFNYKHYQVAHLINIFFNQFHGGMLLGLMVTNCSEQACILYVLFQALALPNVDTVPLPVVLWLAYFSIILMAINFYVFGVAGSLHTLSLETLQQVNLQSLGSGGMMIKLQKRTLRACPPMKIAFGMSNFIEKQTPLLFFEYSIQRFIDLLLFSKE